MVNNSVPLIVRIVVVEADPVSYRAYAALQCHDDFSNNWRCIFDKLFKFKEAETDSPHWRTVELERGIVRISLSAKRIRPEDDWSY